MKNVLLESTGYRVKTLEELKQYVPSAFAETYHPERSKHYSFVPTNELVQALLNLGWELFSGKQNGSSVHSRHIVRFTNPDLGYMDLRSDKVKPQIIIDNSHNGGSSAQLHMGLFRLVCTNGLVVSMPGLYTNVKFRHMGVNQEEIRKLLEVVAEQYKLVGSHIGEMQNVILNSEKKADFVVRAVAQRDPGLFIKDDGTIDTKSILATTNLGQIVEPLRGEDKGNDLWTIFNVVQERLVKGEYTRISRGGEGRSGKARGINHATRNIEFNKGLWEIAESYFPQS